MAVRPLKNFISPFFKALVLHGLVVAVLIYSWAGPEKPLVKPKYNAIKASLVSLPEITAAPKKPKLDKKKQQDAARKKKQEQKKRLEKKRQKKRAKEKARLKAKKAKLHKEKVARQKLENSRKEAAEKQRKANQNAERETMRKKEAQRLAELEQLRAQETRRLDSLEHSEEQKIIHQYIAAIQQQLQRTWSRPPSARKGMQSILRISMIPGGEVVSVSITESSGNAAFDRSVEQAVYRAGILPVPTELALFDLHFRTIDLIFRPEDL